MDGRSCSTLHHSSAAPQFLTADNGQHNEIWPEKWGITVPQVRAFLNSCRADPRWRGDNTMRDLVEQYIKPLTAGTGLGYALHVNRASPKETHIMLSHSWNENVEDFVDTLERTVPGHEPLFICSFCLFQNCDGSGPSIAEQLGQEAHDSPFYRVLRSIASKGRSAGWRWQPNRGLRVLGVLMLTLAACGHFLVAYFGSPVDFCPHLAHATLTAKVCLHVNGDIEELPLSSWMAVVHCVAAFFFLASIVAAVVDWRAEFYHGRMIAVPNNEDKLYSRLWCVYEMFVANSLGVSVELAHTFASVGTSSCRQATCSCEEDRGHICGEIENWGQQKHGSAEQGYDIVDSCIGALTNKARRKYILGTICFLTVWMVYNLWAEDEQLSYRTLVFAVGKLPLVCQLAFSFKFLKRSGGHLSWSRFGVLVGPSMILAFFCMVLGSHVIKHELVGSVVSVFGRMLFFACLITFVLFTAIHLTPTCARYGPKRTVAFWFVYIVLHGMSFVASGFAFCPYFFTWLTSPYLPVLLIDTSVWAVAITCWWLFLVSWGIRTSVWHLGLRSNTSSSKHLVLQAEKLQKEATGSQLESRSKAAADVDAEPAAVVARTFVTSQQLDADALTSHATHAPKPRLEVLASRADSHTVAAVEATSEQTVAPPSKKLISL